MAELTKTQIKKRVSSLLERLDSIKLELEELKDDIENESSNIEPYEGRYDLTPAQETRQEWLDNVAYALEELIDYMDVADLMNYMEE